MRQARQTGMPLSGTQSSRLWHAAVLMVMLLAAVGCEQSPAQPSSLPKASVQGVPAARLARLARGGDITRWFWAVGDVTPQQPLPVHFATYMGDGDLELIHRLGFRCVRLSIEPTLLFQKATPTAVDTATLGYIDTAVKRLMAHDLAVIVDMHDDHPEKPFEHDPDYAAGLALFWQVLARHFSGWNPEMVFLEALNEPVYQLDPRQWLPAQQHLLSVMRAAAPRQTLIATGPLWSSVDGLRMGKPVAVLNMVYTFHFYEPATFTHEGAERWVNGLDRYMTNLPYPSGTRQCTPAVARFTNADVRASALAYCRANWNSAKVDGLIARAAQWSRTNRVPIMAGEFGVYCKHAPPPHRLRWFCDVRLALQRHGIGWTLWGYDDCYRLGRSLDAPGHIVLHWGGLQAPGLHSVQSGTR